MHRLFAIALGLLILAGSAESAPARANGVGPFDDVWVARSGEAYPGSGSSCARPHAVADGVDDQSELNWAVQHLNDHGTLHLCAGIFHLTNPIGRLSPCAPGCYFALPTHLTISGAGMHKTILDGGATYSDGVRTGPGSDIIWAFSDEEELTLSDLTVQNAVEPNGNGAAVSSSAAVAIIRARFYRNETADEISNISGAAIDAPSITIIDSIFAENTADGDGGAINSTHVEVSGSLFLGNSANGEGGAIDAASVVVTNSRFSGNDAQSGGAIKATTLTVAGSTFTNNSADSGGAISVTSMGLTITNSSFASNDAVIDGGAIYAYTATISRSRFTRNTAGEHGGAVKLAPPSDDDLQNLRGNTFSRNTAAAGGAMTLGPCGTPSRSQAARVERANRFSGNRATEQRRTNNIERLEGGCG
jgi:predicted outer membrane repeat protein